MIILMTFYAFLYDNTKPLTSNKGSGKVYFIIWSEKYLILILIGINL